MKKVYSFIMLMVISLVSFSQVITTSNPLNKNAILEEYTGIHCQYCPQGHVIAQAIVDNNPGRAVSIAIHQGSFATPNSGEPDYRTPFGDNLAGQTGLTGYPSGTVNRHVFTGGSTALGRGDWTNDCNIIMAEPSPVNVGISSAFDSITRELTVQVELYYTANSAVPTNYINVALIQDHVFGPQTGGNAGNNYEHMHMLRFLVTGQWGDPVTTTTAGSLVSRTYTYTVPADYNNVPCVVSNCQVAAFVTESHQEIISGDVVDAVGGTNLYIGDFTTTDNLMQLGHPYGTSSFNITANSNIAGTEPFKVWLATDATEWEGSFVIDGTTYTDTAVVDFTKGTPASIQLSVVPHNNAGFYTYTLCMASVNNPNAPVKRIKAYVLSNVGTLMVYAAGDNNASSFQHVYTDAIVAAGDEYHAEMPSTLFLQANDAGILTNINSIFYNVAWTFPAFTDAEATALMSYIDNGGNLFVAGQDIGWDVMTTSANGGHNSPTLVDFYNNYLKATWVDDGSSTNNKLIANTTDSLFGTVATSNVVDVNAGNMYPDQISARDNAMPIFYYNTTLTKIAGLRSTMVDAKVVYIGVGMEMVQDVAVRNDIIKRSWEWFGGVVSGISSIKATGKHLGQNYPNPVTSSTTIALNDVTSSMSVEVLDMTGRVIMTRPLVNGQDHLVINTSSLSDGAYFYRLTNNGNVLETMKMIK